MLIVEEEQKLSEECVMLFRTLNMILLLNLEAVKQLLEKGRWGYDFDLRINLPRFLMLEKLFYLIFYILKLEKQKKYLNF